MVVVECKEERPVLACAHDVNDHPRFLLASLPPRMTLPPHSHHASTQF